MEPILKLNHKKCKYCDTLYQEIDVEGLECSECQQFVHSKCLKRGAVPGGLVGDIFFHFTCQDCSSTGIEHFIRDKMPWLQAILLVLFHMQTRSPGLARKGYFQWKIHIAAFIDRNWDIIFRKDFKRKKKWTGTVSGTLSHYSPHFFKSGTSVFNEQGWWTLTYPKLTPNIVVQLNAELMLEKQKSKELKVVANDSQLLRGILVNKSYVTDEILKHTVPTVEPVATLVKNGNSNTVVEISTGIKNNYIRVIKPSGNKRKKSLLPTVASLGNLPPKKQAKKTNSSNKSKNDLTSKLFKKLSKDISINHKKIKLEAPAEKNILKSVVKPPKFLDPLCHYNTSLEDISRARASKMQIRLTGGVRKEPILSPYTSIHLPPYIQRDTVIKPPWLQLMDELKAKTHRNKPNWELPKRAPIDFTYVQPEHIPAVNTLCNQFFWTGIDLADTLKYPDFSCVVLYRKLIVGFAFIIPDVKFNESYVSFIFTRPGWRNSGIAKFMLYHLIQTSTGRDITLHVSISNPALFLYQKFGFKVECVVLDFYDRYMRDDTRESKHAFFCRLER